VERDFRNACRAALSPGSPASKCFPPSSRAGLGIPGRQAHPRSRTSGAWYLSTPALRKSNRPGLISKGISNLLLVPIFPSFFLSLCTAFSNLGGREPPTVRFASRSCREAEAGLRDQREGEKEIEKKESFFIGIFRVKEGCIGGIMGLDVEKGDLPPKLASGRRETRTAIHVPVQWTNPRCGPKVDTSDMRAEEHDKAEVSYAFQRTPRLVKEPASPREKPEAPSRVYWSVPFRLPRIQCNSVDLQRFFLNPLDHRRPIKPKADFRPPVMR